MLEISRLENIGIIIAVITGIVVVFISIAIYVKAKKNKSSALHLNLRMGVANLHLTVEKLTDLLPRANRSRTRVLETTGNTRSEWKKWDKEFEEDTKTMGKLIEDTSTLTSDFQDLSLRKKKSMLIKVHKFQTQASFLKDKYSESLKQDEKLQEQVVAQDRNWIMRRS